jgi:predicted transcriptional regulator
LKALETVAAVAAKIAPGRLPSFREAHVVEALEKINSEGTMGRLKLSRDLVLGEGEVRTLVRHLDKEGLIKVSRSGISLSEAGRKLFFDLRTVLSEQVEIPSSPLTVGCINVAVQVKEVGNFIKYGLEQRDAAITAGAKGATTLIVTKNGLALPGTGEDVSEASSSVIAALSKLSLKEGDVVVIGSADEKLKAAFGAKAAALELLKVKFGTNSNKNTSVKERKGQNFI